VIYLDDRMADRLGTMRQPGEGYSEVILRMAEIEAAKPGRWSVGVFAGRVIV
jgi:hypothetical protein